MGRIKNIIIEKQREYEEDLDSLRKKCLATKESEFLNFELQQHLSLIWENINEIKRRMDNLEKNRKEKNIFKKPVSSQYRKEKNIFKISGSSQLLFYTLAGFAAIVGIYNKYKN